MATVFGLVALILAALYVMQAAFEPVAQETASPTPGVKVRR